MHKHYHIRLNRFQASLYLLIPGMRIIRSALAVFLCLLFHFVSKQGDPVTLTVASVICTQTNFRSTWVKSFGRAKGTFFAGLYGYLVQVLLIQAFSLSHDSLIYLFAVSILLMPMMHLLASFRTKEGVAIASVVYLIICFGSGRQDPFSFAFQRTMDTLIGITAALLLSKLHFLDRWGKRILIMKKHSKAVLFPDSEALN